MSLELNELKNQLSTLTDQKEILLVKYQNVMGAIELVTNQINIVEKKQAEQLHQDRLKAQAETEKARSMESEKEDKKVD